MASRPYNLCRECDQPMLRKGQRRKNEDECAGLAGLHNHYSDWRIARDVATTVLHRHFTDEKKDASA